MVTCISEEFAGEDGNNKAVTKSTFSKVMKAYGGMGNSSTHSSLVNKAERTGLLFYPRKQPLIPID